MWCEHLLLKLVFINVCTIIAASAQWAIDDSGCRTPDGGVGNCIAVTKCQSMKDFLLKSPKPIPKNVIAAVQSFVCGVLPSGKLKVCCPSEAIEISKLLPPEKKDVDKVGSPDGTNDRSKAGLLPENCGNVNADSRILNGDKAQLFEFPWMVLLWYQTVRVSIGEFDISTTIDSITDEDGTVIQADPVQNMEIEQVLAHPNYNKTVLFGNDIALIRTAQPMKFSPTGAWPLCLPQGAKFSSFNYTKKFATITGWGVTEKQTPSKTLVKAQVPMLPIGDCKRTPAFVDQNIVINDRQLCADSKMGVDSCKGDSGGPLQIVGFLNGEARYIQHGIVSFGTAICRNQSQVPGVYTRVAAYMDWILDNIKA